MSSRPKKGSYGNQRIERYLGVYNSHVDPRCAAVDLNSWGTVHAVYLRSRIVKPDGMVEWSYVLGDNENQQSNSSK